MRHVTLSDYGTFVGCDGNRLVVRDGSDAVAELPLSRLRSLTVARAVSISTDAMLACARRGIRIAVIDWRNVTVAVVSGTQQHATARLRAHQFRFLEHGDVAALSRAFVHGKLRNQRAVLLYFAKYHRGRLATDAARRLETLARKAKEIEQHDRAWRETLMGIEGSGAACYWQALRDAGLLPDSFPGRLGRGAADVTNQALNFGYAILQSYVWQALDNAGLEIYAGVLHTHRPGKPSLVLDVMEEWRPWIVDRVVVKLRAALHDAGELSASLRKRLTTEIHRQFASRVRRGRRRLRLESLLQRQCYRLAGHFAGERAYRPFLFRW